MNRLKKTLLAACLAITLPFQVFSALSQSFITVDGNSPYYPKVTQLFEEVIAPLYGDQDTALQKIASAHDRTCELFVHESDETKQFLGVLVYKTFPVDEFSTYGIDSALEIKTLFVVNPSKNSGRGIGTQLINRLYDYAKNHPQFKNLVVTVSEDKPEALSFFQHKGFKVIDSWPDAYQKGSTEHLLTKRID